MTKKGVGRGPLGRDFVCRIDARCAVCTLSLRRQEGLRVERGINVSSEVEDGVPLWVQDVGYVLYVERGVGVGVVQMTVSSTLHGLQAMTTYRKGQKRIIAKRGNIPSPDRAEHLAQAGILSESREEMMSMSTDVSGMPTRST